MSKCDKCGKEQECLRLDPYQTEIGNSENPDVVCDECYSLSNEEI